MYTVCIRGAILWGVLCNKAHCVYSGTHASYLWNVFLLVVSASMQNRFVSSKALHSQFAHSCIPKVYGQLFLDLVLAVSIIEAYLCMIEARALDETKRMAADTKKSYVCVCGRSLMQTQSCPDMLPSLSVSQNQSTRQQT